MGKHIKVLTAIFENEIASYEIPYFRGAVIASMGNQANLLFHNHVGDSDLRYSYPLIQYKRIKNRATIVCIEEGVDVIGQFLEKNGGILKIGERKMEIHMDKLVPSRIFVQTWNSDFVYHLHRWLPLNSKNYLKFQEINSLTERIFFLENILRGNLLSMLKGVGIHLEEELTVKIKSLSDPYMVKNKGVSLMAFNVDFISNLSIPNNIGLGKNASIGYGIVTEKKNKI